METLMQSRLMIAAAALLTSAAAPAEPVKAPVPQQGMTTDRARPMMLASADRIAAPIQAQASNAATTKRPRVGRVTTCRCGGDPEPEQQEEQ
jgi:hypothetical protein